MGPFGFKGPYIVDKIVGKSSCTLRDPLWGTVFKKGVSFNFLKIWKKRGASSVLQMEEQLLLEKTKFDDVYSASAERLECLKEEERSLPQAKVCAKCKKKCARN